MARSTVSSTNTAASTNLTREQFVREYMQQLSAARGPKVGLTERLATFVEDRLVGAVKNSRRTGGRLRAAWEIAGSIADAAYAEEHARHAEEMARRLGYE